VSVLVAQVNEDRVLVVLDPQTVIGVALLVQGPRLCLALLGDERSPA